MNDVARLAGVSIATVSATISGRAYVSPELQERVRSAIAELKYRPNKLASNLKRGRTLLIGLIVPDITNPFFTELIAEFQSCARADGFSVILGISAADPAREIELIEYVAGQHAEALVICTTGHAGETVEALRSAAGQMSLVLVDQTPAGIEADTIALDNFAAGEMATRHILSFGHRHVAVISGPLGARSSDERVRGYHAALRGAGITPALAWRRDGGFTTEQAYEATRGLLRDSTPPTAIFVCNNLMLIGVMRAISEAGVSVPEQVSIVNIDDFPWASAFRPAMTAVRQPTSDMAKAAYELAKARIEGLADPAIHQVFTPELVERASVAKPNRVVATPDPGWKMSYRIPARKSAPTG